MNIRIIGPGVVGKATGEGFCRYGHDVTYADKGDSLYHPGEEAYFICTPEEAVPDVVAVLVSQIKAHDQTEGPAIAVRSTTPPGTVQALADLHGYELVHNPEFLREASAEQDFMNAPYALIGATREVDFFGPSFNTIQALYYEAGIQPMACTATASELVKLITNCHLATLISFWNEMSGICEKLGVNSHLVGRLATMDPRVVPYGALMHGKPFGGHCLPKDLAQLIKYARDNGAPCELLRAVNSINALRGGPY